jgi:hypothetical protein
MASLNGKKTFIRSFVKEIIVIEDEVVLNYSIPMQPRGITEERFPVLPIKHDGGR